MPNKTIRPAPGRVVIRKLEDAEARIDLGTTPSGQKAMLIIPSTAQNSMHEAHLGVVEQESPPYRTGNGAEVEPSFRNGQVVIFGKFTGSKVSVNNRDLYIMSEQQIIGELVEVPDAQDASEQPSG